MRNIVKLIFLLTGATLVLAACSSGASTGEADTGKPVMIQIESNPDPAVVGDVTFTLQLSDANGDALEGARVDIAVDHTDMTGMSMSGSATEQEAGQYAISANFSMSGNWKMTVYVRKDSLDYKEDFDLKIQ